MDREIGGMSQVLFVCLQDEWSRLKADERFGRVGAIVKERQLLFFIDKEEAAPGKKAGTLPCRVGYPYLLLPTILGT